MNTRDLEQIEQELALMARTAEAIYGKAVRVIDSKNEALAEEILREDSQLDQLELSLDQKCMKLLELKGAFAMDFRFVYSVIKTNKDLERVGDESKTIAKWAHRVTEKPHSELHTLAEKSLEALSKGVSALIEGDAKLAREVLQLESVVDDIEDRIIESNPDLAQGLIVRAMERVADMATNIAENVIFAEEAKDIRHGSAVTI